MKLFNRGGVESKQVRVSYKEYRKARRIISYLNYYWEFVGKDNKKITKRFSKIITQFNEQNLEELYASIHKLPWSNMVMLSNNQFETLQQLVTLTNTLERMSKRNRGAEIRW